MLRRIAQLTHPSFAPRSGPCPRGVARCPSIPLAGEVFENYPHSFPQVVGEDPTHGVPRLPQPVDNPVSRAVTILRRLSGEQAGVLERFGTIGVSAGLHRCSSLPLVANLRIGLPSGGTNPYR
ncbi:hypothetical protein FM114_06015 [Luteococcus japonicus LSP_Lj1]|uniref:Uncharacterized protein n=1 Tax=Luteococcus japonicus LSP_Lj1 TaxID=1255658 RepID=A0A1R4J927_9ACTN|nr:hypothetical protein FM114_06015 [Luteococcus japonicus LSP_Lj1]